jgi:hypothetical protein
MRMNEKQKKTLAVLQERWDFVSEPFGLIGEPEVVMVQVSNNGAGVMTIGIEPDGHAHS